MSPNPYQPPSMQTARDDREFNRRPLVLAAIASGLTSAYWGVLTLLILIGVGAGTVSPLQIILPCVLIFLYAWRAYQLYNGDRAAATRLIWLHGVGGVMGLVRLASGDGFVVVLYGIKIVLHIFGALTAYSAQRALAAQYR